MTTIFLVVLFITQIISFYFLAILYTKVSKQDEFERKQKRFMEEMDDSLAAYLVEVKDENEKLLGKMASAQGEKPEKVIEEKVESTVGKQKPPREEAPLINITTPTIPVNLALKSYSKMQYEPVEESEPEVEVDERTRIVRLHNAGKSIEEIARTLGKGRTEIELILKFK